jgi:hypothetical protein
VTWRPYLKEVERIEEVARKVQYRRRECIWIHIQRDLGQVERAIGNSFEDQALHSIRRDLGNVWLLIGGVPCENLIDECPNLDDVGTTV